MTDNQGLAQGSALEMTVLDTSHNAPIVLPAGIV
jgi:hypothetical protein